MKKRRLTLGNVYLFIAFLLMYAPIIVLVVFSFNKGAVDPAFLQAFRLNGIPLFLPMRKPCRL